MDKNELEIVFESFCVFNWLKTAKMIVNKQPLFLPEKAAKLKAMLALSAALMVLGLCVSLT